MNHDGDPVNTELEELWALVDELGDLSERLRRAADAAVAALNVHKEEDA